MKISPRKKLMEESHKYTLLRRLEEFAEYAYNTKKFHDLDLYLLLIDYIEKGSD